MLDLSVIPFLILLLNIFLLAVGVYVLYLVIKALRIYIKKNS
ncbi:MAG: hypothetical protein PHF63_10360 [Herbinix sp.]|nr:hypothetical protein [Herbinix sp.]